MIPDSPTFSVREIADLFQIQEETARRWIRRGELSAIRMPGRGAGYQVKHTDLARFVEAQYRFGSRATSLPHLQPEPFPEPERDLSKLNEFSGLVYVATGSFWARQVVANNGKLRYVEHFRTWVDCIYQGDRLLAETSRASGSLTLEYRLLDPGGAEVWVADTATHAGDQRWFGVVQDITESRKQRLAHNRESLAYNLLERAFAGDNVYDDALALASALPGVASVEAIQNADRRNAPELVDVTIPGRPNPWGVLRIHTGSPGLLTEGLALLEVIASAIGVSILEDQTRQRPVRWYSTRDIARLLKVKEETVRRWIRREELQIITLGSLRAGYRVHPVDLDAFIRERYRQLGSTG